MLAPKDNRHDPLVIRLIREAEIEAERTLSIIRIAVALLLAVWAFSVAGFQLSPLSVAEMPSYTATGLAISSLLLVGIASYALAATDLARQWATYVFAAFDAVAISTAAWLILDRGGLSGNWISAVPPVWAVPLLLSVGAFRYQPWTLVWSTLLFIGALSIVAFVMGFDPAGPESVSSSISGLFALPPTAARALLLLLTGIVAAIAMRRARLVLVRGVSEATRRANLSRFLPAEIAPVLESSETRDWREGHRQIVTVMFVDIRNSTTTAEALDPRKLSILISSFRRRILRAATASGGVVDKFIGDGALILFGVPEPSADDAKRALNCARDILRSVDRWNERRQFDPPIRVGIGLHAGEVFCGIVGDAPRLEFTVLGDVVNVAARIEEATKEHNAPLLASAAVIAAAGEQDEWRVLSLDPLRGRAGSVRLQAPLRSPSDSWPQFQ